MAFNPDIFQKAFPSIIPQPPAPPVVEPEPLLPAFPAPPQKEEISPEVSAQIQNIVWGQGQPINTPPPSKQVDKGSAPAMGDDSGWGKTNG